MCILKCCHVIGSIISCASLGDLARVNLSFTNLPINVCATVLLLATSSFLNVILATTDRQINGVQISFKNKVLYKDSLHWPTKTKSFSLTESLPNHFCTFFYGHFALICHTCLASAMLEHVKHIIHFVCKLN